MHCSPKSNKVVLICFDLIRLYHIGPADIANIKLGHSDLPDIIPEFLRLSQLYNFLSTIIFFGTGKNQP